MSADAPRIIFVPFIDAFGGVERLVLGLSRYLHERGKQHQVVCFRDTIDLRTYAEWELRVEQLRPRRHPLKEALCLGQCLRQVTGAGALPPLVFDLRGAFYAALFTLPGFTLHLTDPPSLLPTDSSKGAPSIRKMMNDSVRDDRRNQDVVPGVGAAIRAEIVHRLNSRGVRKARAVIVMTQVIAKEVQALYRVGPHVVRPGVAVDLGSAAANNISATEPIRLLSVSRLESNKRIDWILRSLATVDTEPAGGESWRLDVVGDGAERQKLESVVRELRLDGRVVIHGRVADEQLQTLYAQAHLFLMPAVQGYGLPALEALAAGVPVVLHHDSGVAEVLRDSPWVEILRDRNDSLPNALKKMFGRIRGGILAGTQPPKIPREADWASEVCRIAQWS